MTSIQTIDPTTALGLAETPRAAATPATASAPTTSGLLDDFGALFDPIRHARDRVGNPKKTAKGRWAMKTGNGALKLQGKPLSGVRLNGAATRPEPGPSAAASPEAPADPSPAADAPRSLPGGSTYVPPSATPGEAGAVDAVVEPVAMLTPDDCRPTAQAVCDGALGIARMWRGDHWQATPQERTQLVESLARVWSAYQLPRLGPVVELVMILVGFIAGVQQRVGDLRQLWAWALGRRKVKADAADATTAGGAQPA